MENSRNRHGFRPVALSAGVKVEPRMMFSFSAEGKERSLSVLPESGSRVVCKNRTPSCVIAPTEGFPVGRHMIPVIAAARLAKGIYQDREVVGTPPGFFP